MSRNQTLKDIFAPSWLKIGLAVVVAAFAHLFIVVASVRTAGEDLEQVREFWLTNLINALPYLETDSVILKFVTFFVASYAIVWIFSKMFTAFDNLQTMATKRLRRHS